jgi:CO/xanthine dehydrogenase FAD-binding subunit
MRVLAPTTLDEALAVRAAEPEAVPLAGGTDLLVAWHSGDAPPPVVVTLSGIASLREIAWKGGRAEIGAGVRHAELADDERVRTAFPALAEAASVIGAPAVRNMGTIAGNLVTASPAADLPPVLLALDATVRLASTAGRRDVSIDRFFTGYRRVDVRPGELVVAISIPEPPAGSVVRFTKIGTRRAQSCAKLSLAARARLDGGRVADIRLAAGSVADVPLRLETVERLVAGVRLDPALAARAGAEAADSVRPIDDVRSTAAYRRAVLGRLVEDFLLELQG